MRKPLFAALTALVLALVTRAVQANGPQTQSQDVQFFPDRSLKFEAGAAAAPDAGVPPAVARASSAAPADRPAAEAASRAADTASIPPTFAVESQVVSVRKLSAQDIATVGPHLSCGEAVAAEVVLSDRMRKVVAKMFKLAPEALPQQLTWVTGLDRTCFDRRTLDAPTARLMERLDSLVVAAAKKDGM
jgi:hypothetical protein